jgi:RNA polymerase primary sigma factor
MRISDYTCKYFTYNAVLNSFLNEIRKYPVPSVQEEEELFDRYRNGDERARDLLIVGHLRFVYSLAKIYARNESEVTDYVNEGVYGLLLALDDFDPTKGYKFITYGVWYIRRQMNYYMLTKRDMVSHSAQIGNINRKSDMYRQKYFAEFGKMPTNEEVMDVLKNSFNINVSKVEDLFETGVSSIDEDVCEDYTLENTSEYNEVTASVNEYETESEREYNMEILKEYLSALPEKAADIIKMRFGVGYERPYTDEEIGEKYGIDPERIDGICGYAISTMRKVPVKRAI